MQTIELRTTRASDRIALRGVRLRARLAGMAQRTVVEQTFVNLENRAIEAIYTFPLPEGAAVCGFEVITGDRVLTGVVEEANQAAEQYDDAISEGHGAFIVEEDRPDVFTARVGNIKPRQAATIRLTYVCALDRVDRQVRVAFPTTLAPRYVTSTGGDPIEAMIDGDALNPPRVLSVPYGLTIDVEVDLGPSVRSIHSPSHPLRVHRGPEDASPWRIAFEGAKYQMNRDVVLSIEFAREHEPSLQIERGPKGESYLAVTFVPEFDEDELTETAARSDTVFVLDCSGSMQGDSIRQAVGALELCLRSMSAGDTFNICRFGSNYEMFRNESVVYSQHTLDQAIRFARRDADLGGTELYPPLEAIFNVRPRAGTVRQVILLTDGQVTNEPEVIELARRHRGQNRIFTFGIGSASSSYLVNGLARATRGAAEFITIGERIDDKVLRTFGRLMSPLVTDVSIDWDGRDVQTLAEIPPVFDGDVLTVFGRTDGKPPTKVTLSCRTPNGPKRWTLPVLVHPVANEDRTIATMWARRMIQSLEEVNSIQRTRTLPMSREAQTLINLSRQFGLLCSLTTFIAIEHRSVLERNEGRPALRRVPVVMVEADLLGLAGSNDTALGAVLDEITPSASGSGLYRSAMPSPEPTATRGRFIARALKKAFGGGGPAATDMSAAAPAQSPIPPSPAQKTIDKTLDRSVDRSFDSVSSEAEVSVDFGGDPLLAILACQRADGSFSDPPLEEAAVSSSDLSAWRTTIDASVPSELQGEFRRKVADTLLTIAILHDRFGDRRDLWTRAYRKACTDFLTKELSMSVADLTEWMEKLLHKRSTEAV